MPAYSEDGIATRDRVMRTLGELAKLVPQYIIDGTDWDAMSRTHRVPWTEEEMYGQSHMSWDDINRLLDEYAAEKKASAIGGVSYEVEQEARDLENRTHYSGIPERYKGVPIDLTYLPDIDAKKGLYIVGAQGSGKTFKACATLRGWMTRNQGRGLFVTSVRLLTEITATYSNSSTVLEVVDRYGRCPLLVIDDLGKEAPTEHSLEMLWYVINTRYEWNVPTIITSQYPLADLAARMSEKGNVETASSIVSRIRETSREVKTGDVDMRLRQSFITSD